MAPCDKLIEEIASYTKKTKTFSKEAKEAACLCLADAMGCAILALKNKDCSKLIGPWIPDASPLPAASPCSRVPGTKLALDPIQATFCLGAMIRWLDYNDTFLAQEWAHPSDNIGALLPLLDYLSCRLVAQGKAPLFVDDLLVAMIKAYEIQGSLAIKTSLNQVGLDHVMYVKVAISALGTHLLGGQTEDVVAALSQAFIDLGPLRTYRHSPNTGPRKSWAAADAAKRGLELAFLTMKGEPGYPAPLTSPRWGLQDAVFQGHALELALPLESKIIENILFKVSFPAEFHAQTAVEAALKLRPLVANKLDLIQSIKITSHAAALLIIDKKGPLTCPADRDHCLQYMVACALIFGELSDKHYEDEIAKDPRIDFLREKMHLSEYKEFTNDYHDPKKRSIPNSIEIELTDGSSFGPTTVFFPLGHPSRRKEAIPHLFQKLKSNLLTHYSQGKANELTELFQNPHSLARLSIPEFVHLFSD